MKKGILFFVAVVALVSCSSEETKVDVASDAKVLTDKLVKIVDAARVGSEADLDLLAGKVDSIQASFEEFYKAKGEAELDSLRAEFAKTGRVKIDSALNAKRATLN